MKVFVLCSTDWIYTLPLGFKEAGHEVRKSGVISEEGITNQIARFKPDFILSLGWTEDQSIERQLAARRVVEKFGIPHVYWNVEDPAYTLRFSLPFIERVKPDFIFTICPKTVEQYKAMGIKSAYMDFGYSETVHKSVMPREEYKHSIAIVANAYPELLQIYPKHYRNQSIKTLITPLLKENIRIDFWGDEWDKSEVLLGHSIPKEWIHGKLPYIEANKVYSSCDIMIGPQNYTNMVTQRTYEILASGGVLLTSDTDGVRALFKPGEHLITSSSPEETVRLVKHYLSNKDHRRKIALQAPGAVLGNSYRERAEYMIGVLNREGILKKYS
ncbi:glycosyltransferase [Clostridium sp. DJ247]|uniref:CgeB family protein n=1 Tax=Clostridium sp. DJ247 TaxID=2726188 RepID=UPI00162669B1|nr:glycosyltransferase [Clostridium sp. DJ247]MBC2580270.1 glycosyltransferase [Clostridium sp. DJ247]